jgi:hypothetical protein
MTGGPKLRFTQTVIGSCGHQLEGWGAVRRLREGNTTWVPCPDCSLAKTGLPVESGEMPSVWVRIDKVKERPQAQGKKRAPRGTKAEKKPARKPRAWEIFLADD